MKLAHIGVAVKQIESASAMLQKVLDARPTTGIVHDPQQDAMLQMLNCGGGAVELIAPASEKSNVWTALKHKGEGLLHLCFDTPDLDQTLQAIRSRGAIVFSPPKPAVLFGGRRVAFVMLPNQMVIEFVEAGSKAPSPAPQP